MAARAHRHHSCRFRRLCRRWAAAAATDTAHRSAKGARLPDTDTRQRLPSALLSFVTRLIYLCKGLRAFEYAACGSQAHLKQGKEGERVEATLCSLTIGAGSVGVL
eukprot:IDg3432t1